MQPRRRFVAGTLAAAVAATGAANARAQSAAGLRWRLRTQGGRGQEQVVASLARFAEGIATMSGGRLRIDIETADDPGGRLPPLQSLRAGEVDAVHVDASTLVEHDPLFAFLGNIPYGMAAPQHEAWLRHGGGLAVLRPALLRSGVVAFPAGGSGIQMGGWYRREIRSPDDLKGLRVRISDGLEGSMFARLGVALQRLPENDVLAALSAGRLDGAIGSGPPDDERRGWYKAARFYHYPLAQGGGHQFAVLVRAEAWVGLAAELKALFEAACTDAGQDVLARYAAQTPRALRQLLANGVQLRPFPPELARTGFAAASEALAAAGSGDEFRQVHAAWKAFRDDQIRAFGLADARNTSLLHGLIAAPGTGTGTGK
jgi:TRAP-type mannitol/chloroaromatic compound transport system substrate-binding protein